MTTAARHERVIEADQPITLTTGVLCLLAAMSDQSVYFDVDRNRAAMERLLTSHRADPDLQLMTDDRMLLDVAAALYAELPGPSLLSLEAVSATCRNIIFHVLRLVWA